MAKPILVTSSQTIEFPKYKWSITAGDAKALPDSKEAQERILSEPSIDKVKGDTSNSD
jgi:hypothetical protein